MGTKSKLFTNERVAWNRIQGKSQRCVGKRKSLNKIFKKVFPKQVGSEEEILRLAALYFTHKVKGGEVNPTSWLRWLESMHPDAFRFLVRHGQFYKPLKWHRVPKLEPRSGQCFRNAALVTHSRQRYLDKRKNCKTLPPLMYVEGLAMGVLADPMLHAWNTEKPSSKECIDWSFYAGSEWVRYLGIPVSAEEYKELCACRSPRHKRTAIFHKQTFTIKMRVCLLDILRRRKRAGKKLRSRKKRGSFYFCGHSSRFADLISIAEALRRFLIADLGRTG